VAEGSLITEELRKMIGVPSEPIIFKVEAGLSLSTVSHIEQGEQVEISWSALDTLDKVFGQRGKPIFFYRNRQR